MTWGNGGHGQLKAAAAGFRTGSQPALEQSHVGIDGVTGHVAVVNGRFNLPTTFKYQKLNHAGNQSPVITVDGLNRNKCTRIRNIHLSKLMKYEGERLSFSFYFLLKNAEKRYNGR